MPHRVVIVLRLIPNKKSPNIRFMFSQANDFRTTASTILHEQGWHHDAVLGELS